MINGLILYKEGDSTGSRLLLTKALKQAHGMVGSGQFVGQILNALAPVQKQRNDHAGALQMFESATTLLKSVKDLMSLVTTLIGMQKLYSEMNQPGEFFGLPRDVLARHSKNDTQADCQWIPLICRKSLSLSRVFGEKSERSGCKIKACV